MKGLPRGLWKLRIELHLYCYPKKNSMTIFNFETDSDIDFEKKLSMILSILQTSPIVTTLTRVTDMQVRHNFSARHNLLPAKPLCRQQIELTFL
jgi:hypothetical protein